MTNRTYPQGVPCWVDTEQPDVEAATAAQEYCHRRRRLRPAGRDAGGSGALLHGDRDGRVQGLPVAAAGFRLERNGA